MSAYPVNAAENLFAAVNNIVGQYDVDQQKIWKDAQNKLLAKTRPIPENEKWELIRQDVNFNLTPAMARYLDDNYNVFLGQRNKTSRRKDMIATAALTGTWHGNKIVFAILGEPYQTDDDKQTKVLLLNGGNSIGACLEYGITLPSNIFQVIYAPTVKAAANCYYNMDRKESTRTADEQHKAVLAGEENVEDWKDQNGCLRPKIFKNCVTAAMVVEYGPSYRSKKFSELEKVHFVQANYVPQMDWLREYIFNDPKTPKYMKGVVGVLSVIMHTYIAWGDVCKMFWDDLKRGYRATPNNRMTGSKTNKRTPQDALMGYLTKEGKEDESTTFSKVMSAANAWASGKDSFSFKGNKIWDSEPITMNKFRPHQNCRPTKEEACEEEAA